MVKWSSCSHSTLTTWVETTLKHKVFSVQKNENKQKEAGVGPFFKKSYTLEIFFLFFVAITAMFKSILVWQTPNCTPPIICKNCFCQSTKCKKWATITCCCCCCRGTRRSTRSWWRTPRSRGTLRSSRRYQTSAWKSGPDKSDYGADCIKQFDSSLFTTISCYGVFKIYVPRM